MYLPLGLGQLDKFVKFRPRESVESTLIDDDNLQEREEDSEESAMDHDNEGVEKSASSKELKKKLVNI